MDSNVGFVGGVISIEKNREKRAIVQHLMMYRNVGADELDWIKMMNIVDVVFHDNERVRQLWQLHNECIVLPRFHTGEHIEVFYEMLYEMCQDCGYNQMMKADLKNVYSPIALSEHYPHRYQPPADINEPPYPGILEEIMCLGLA